MPKINIGIGASTLAVFSFETQNIAGKDGPEFPLLTILYDLQLGHYRNSSESGVPIHPVTCLYLAGELWSQQKVVARFHEDLALVSPNPAQGYLEIPLDILTVERIEQARPGDFVGALKCRALLAVHAHDNGSVEKFVMAESQPTGFSISKSHWIERILPQLGYGRLELLEVRLSNAMPPDYGLPKAVAEIRRARDFFVAGEWDKAVAQCRMAIETIPDSRPLKLNGTPRFAQKVDTFVNEHLKVGDEEAKFLAGGMNALWAVCSRPVHPSASTFRRADAEFILRNTTAIVEYVGRLLSQ